MSYFDIILIILTAWAAISGFRKGFVMQLFGLLALFVGIFCAYQLSDTLASLVHKMIAVDKTSIAILLFAITLIAVWAIILALGKMLEKVLKIAALGFINRLFGVIFSVAKAGFIIGVVVIIISYFNLNRYEPIGNDLAKSKLYEPLKQIAHAAFPYIIFGKDTQDTQFNVNLL